MEDAGLDAGPVMHGHGRFSDWLLPGGIVHDEAGAGAGLLRNPAVLKRPMDGAKPRWWSRCLAEPGDLDRRISFQ